MKTLAKRLKSKSKFYEVIFKTSVTSSKHITSKIVSSFNSFNSFNSFFVLIPEIICKNVALLLQPIKSKLSLHNLGA